MYYIGIICPYSLLSKLMFLTMSCEWTKAYIDPRKTPAITPGPYIILYVIYPHIGGDIPIDPHRSLFPDTMIPD